MGMFISDRERVLLEFWQKDRLCNDYCWLVLREEGSLQQAVRPYDPEWEKEEQAVFIENLNLFGSMMASGI